MAFPFRASAPNWFAPWRQDRPADARLLDDLVAAVIVTLLLIPQSLAYAVLAGVPAHLGLYASIFPL
ncbi:MAG: SulP family inorganic anion transporter, partial [Burkholderiaceae bacterium]